MTLSVTISQPHDRLLSSHLFPRNGCESGAILLFGTAVGPGQPWDKSSFRRYLSHSVTTIPNDDIVEASPNHFSWVKRTFLQLLKRAMTERLAIGFVHSHRGTSAFFSPVDDQNDRDVAELVANRTRRQVEYVSLVMDEQGRYVARVPQKGGVSLEVSRCSILGSPWRWYCPYQEGVTQPFERQALAFGPEFLRTLRKMRIGIVGAGATGSATAVLLARNGATELALFDPDSVELSNLSRLHGASMRHAIEGVAKVTCLKEHIEGFGLGTHVQGFQNWIGDVSVRDVVRTCDLIFCCSDDHSGRMFLNRIAYFYNTPVIDMGIGIDPRRVREGFISHADARVTVLAPGTPCLLCRRIVDVSRARSEELFRANPAEHLRQQADGYISGYNVPNPAVIALTTSVACLGVDELTARLTGYRCSRDGRVQKFRIMRETFPGVDDNRTCPICVDETYWGRGDVQPFLDRIG